MSSERSDHAAEENLVALWRDAVRLFNEVGPTAYLERSTDDVVLRTVDDFPGGGTFRGRQEVIRFMNEFVEAFEIATYESADHRVIGNEVVASARWVTTGRSSGAATTMDFFSVASFRDGLLEDVTLFWTEEEALKEAASSSG